METTFVAPDIECDGCATSITKALSRQPGVRTVAVDVPTKTVTVQHDTAAVSPDALARALDEIGFPKEK